MTSFAISLLSILVINIVSQVICQESNFVDDPVVRVNEGKLRGIVLKSRNGRSYAGFLGVNYAAKPERFEVAKSAEKWKGVRNATSFGPVCPHHVYESTEFRGEENCLSSNIYSPKLDGNMPVMVFIHGGCFMWGDSTGYGAKYLMDEDIVLVTVNYRLGILGFLSTQDDVFQGNLGLKDQAESLKWIKENIANFGGDPSKVTIIGSSAGAMSVNYHLLSPMSKGLFHRAISLSGTVLTPLALQRYPKANARKLGAVLNCPLLNGKIGSESFKTCLKTKTTREIVDAQLTFRNDFGEIPCVFAPSVEKVSKDSENPTFISDLPYALLTDEKLKHKLNSNVPWITGLCEEENISAMALVLNETEFSRKLTRLLNENRSTIFPMVFLYENTVKKEDLESIADEIHKFYFGNRKIGKETAKEFSNLFSDRWNNHGIRTAAKLAAKQGFTVYSYVFAFNGSFSFSEFFGGSPNYKGVEHMDDLQYLFNITLFYLNVPEISQPEGEESKFSINYVKLWTTFASNDGTTFSTGHKWTPNTRVNQDQDGEPLWYIIDKNNKMSEVPIYSSRMKFWDKLPMLLEMENDVSGQLLRDEL